MRLKDDGKFEYIFDILYDMLNHFTLRNLVHALFCVEWNINDIVNI